MKLFVWNDVVDAYYSGGQISVLAETVEDARKMIKEEFSKSSGERGAIHSYHSLKDLINFDVEEPEVFDVEKGIVTGYTWEE